MDDYLSTQFSYYKKNQDKLVRQYDGKVIVLCDFEVIGVYDDYVQAVEQSRKDHEMGTFLVQACSPGPDAYTLTIFSHELLAQAA